MEIVIRKGVREDIASVFELVLELAKFERALDQVRNTVDRMSQDYDQGLYDFFVAQTDDGKTIGLALYYFRYSTWKGKRLYMEDIIVTESMRGQGIGKRLFDDIVQEAKDSGSTGLMWQVLDWNTSAVSFYRKYGTDFDDEWLNCNIDF
jgi:GNAT superfamily N-acetyltransferase